VKADKEGDDDEDTEKSEKKSDDEEDDCVDLINRYEVGILTGKLFASFFNSSLKPLET